MKSTLQVWLLLGEANCKSTCMKHWLDEPGASCPTVLPPVLYNGSCRFIESSSAASDFLVHLLIHFAPKSNRSRSQAPSQCSSYFWGGLSSSLRQLASSLFVCTTPENKFIQMTHTQDPMVPGPWSLIPMVSWVGSISGPWSQVRIFGHIVFSFLGFQSKLNLMPCLRSQV